MVAFKRVVFWTESALTALLFCVGLGLTTKMVLDSRSLADSVTSLGIAALYLVDIALASIPELPGLAMTVILALAAYVASFFYFAQTDFERRCLKVIVPISVVMLPLNTIVIFVSAVAGLASQGAGH